MGKRTIVGVLVLVFLTVLPGVAWAGDFRAGDDNPEVSGTVDDDVYVVGNEILVAGDVTGDVFAAGRSVRMTGSTGQSFFAGAQTVDITGRVEHSARVGAQEVEVSGAIAQDLLGAGQSVLITPEGSVGRDLVAGGQDVEIAGSVGRHVLGAAPSVVIRGTVGGDVKLETDDVTLAEGARIEGDLIYTSANEADIDPGAVVAGEIERREPRSQPEERPAALQALIDFIQGVVGAFVLGLIVLWLVPGLLPTLARTMRDDWAPSLGAGIGAFFAVPIVAVIALVIVIFTGAFGSIPLLLLAIYGFLLLLAKVAVGYLIGLLILGKGSLPAAVDFRFSLKALALGVTVLVAATMIPFLGGLVGFVAAVLTLGAGIVALFRWRKARAVPAAAPPPAPVTAA
jgi:cytoskeletal protein CcmA (bactofilin family)